MDSKKPAGLDTVLVIGAGTMGVGIAQAVLAAGFGVHIVDTRPDALAQCLAVLQQRFASLHQKGKLRAAPEVVLQKFTAGTFANAPAYQLVIEAVAEDLAIKQSVLAQAYASQPQAYFATNTSSLSINAIAANFAAPARFLGLHFFNPAPLMPLVELVQGTHTDPSTLAWAKSFCTALGKTAVLVADSPGFIVNRVARPFYTETMRATEQHQLAFADADAAMRGQGFKMGPFQLMDMIGLDINFNVTCQVWEGLGKPPRFLPPNLQATRIEKGHLGVKTGHGFYTYPAA